MNWFYKYFENSSKLAQSFLILLICAILCSSCEKSIDYQIENQQSKIVLYTFPMPDSTLKVHLSYTTDILSQKEYEGITNSTLNISLNNELIISDEYPDGEEWFSIENVDLSYNDTINIEVDVNDSINVYSNTTIPEPVQIVLIDTVRVLEFNDENIEEEMLQCKLSFFDPSGESNFYQLRVDSYSDIVENSTNIRQIETVDIVENDKVFISRDYEATLLAEIDYQSTFDDLLFNGQFYSLTFLIPNSYIENSGLDEKKSLHFYLFSLSNEYYEYIRSVSEQDAFREDPFYEQSNVYSNVVNGLGAAAGLSVDVDSIEIYNNLE